jgi:hypothetical protein
MLDMSQSPQMSAATSTMGAVRALAEVAWDNC